MPEPTDIDAEADRMIAAMLPVLGIAIEPEWHATVRANLVATLRVARLALDVEIDDHEDAGPVFVP